jgi:hypothetical protein
LTNLSSVTLCLYVEKDNDLDAAFDSIGDELAHGEEKHVWSVVRLN